MHDHDNYFHSMKYARRRLQTMRLPLNIAAKCKVESGSIIIHHKPVPGREKHPGTRTIV
jgi:hypothetical protein